VTGELLALSAIVAIALAFAFTNGFHDAANAIATSIGTRALTPHIAVVMAAAMNLLGATLSTRRPHPACHSPSPLVSMSRPRQRPVSVIGDQFAD
jgi:PiT family inorganic phosphate transporter